MLTLIVQYLGEIEYRRLAAARGFPSVFMFCVEELGYSENAAITRIRTARLVREIPEALAAFEGGKLSLSVAARAQTCFVRNKNTKFDKSAVLSELYGKKISEADRILATHFPQPPARELKIPLNEELTKIQFTLTSASLEKMEKLLDIRSHKNPYRRLDLMMEDLLHLGLKTWDPLYVRERPKMQNAAG
ncbi:MAG: hypothetical protein ACXWR1_15665 [Bdellovibrionota bacterium]